MSSLLLKLRLFFSLKVLTFTILFGLLGYFVVGSLIHSIVSSVEFTGPLQALQAPVQEMILDRGNKAVWLWTILPAQIAWMLVSSAVRKAEAI